MFKEKIKEYFSFTKKERIGIFSLSFLIVVIFIAPYFFSNKENKSSKQEFEKFKNEIAQLKTQQTDSNRFAKKEDDDKSYYEPFPKKEKEIKTELFYFDPNAASAEEWKRLGVRDKTIHTIKNYLSKGGKFKNAEDLQKIYGLQEDEYHRLEPYIKIEKQIPGEKKEFKPEINERKNFPEHKTKVPETIDINDADTAKFIALPGIGNKLAARIISFREKLGGFYSIDQISETYNLPDSTFQKIKPFLKVSDKKIKKININTADANALKSHPYIRWSLANAIIQYRNEHGNYKSAEDLKQIMIITPEAYLKIAPYIFVSE